MLAALAQSLHFSRSFPWGKQPNSLFSLPCFQSKSEYKAEIKLKKRTKRNHPLYASTKTPMPKMFGGTKKNEQRTRNAQKKQNTIKRLKTQGKNTKTGEKKVHFYYSSVHHHSFHHQNANQLKKNKKKHLKPVCYQHNSSQKRWLETQSAVFKKRSG